MINNVIILIFLSLFFKNNEERWGFFAHKEINKLAIFTLPIDMIPFYKRHLEDIVEKSVKPDMRRYSDLNEAPRHYIDLDLYPENIKMLLPISRREAADSLGEAFVTENGIVPWHILNMKYRLTKAFKNNEMEDIISLSAEIGHYIADSNVPLHTTSNYNGQLTGQDGIHGLWESRLPELFCKDFNLYTGKAEYIRNVSDYVWNNIFLANNAVDSLLSIENALSNREEFNNRFVVEDRNGIPVNTYSYEYSEVYHKKLNGMVERQMRRSIKAVGDIWFTCWVDAGQPKL